MQPIIQTRRSLTVNLAAWKQLDAEQTEASGQLEQALQMAAWAVSELRRSKRLTQQ